MFSLRRTDEHEAFDIEWSIVSMRRHGPWHSIVWELVVTGIGEQGGSELTIVYDALACRGRLVS